MEKHLILGFKKEINLLAFQSVKLCRLLYIFIKDQISIMLVTVTKANIDDRKPLPNMTR
ncbi:hypothetical protein BTN49_0953 [Candidatus Enterovibrio escicola]|uniref:Uncharacterized protein n=1 Tax=Candidatus Enterovibrio escicola TaxID=1927127 RepID=A0A2A5T5E0_9GAMM|nr:hypothetical protein BTN49_0953 [Candidatus Enterovibrio escacola]